MRQFDGIRDWYAFKEYISFHRCFWLPFSKEQTGFLQTIVEVAKKNQETISPGKKFYRARIGCMERKLVGKDEVIMPAQPYCGVDINIPPFKKREPGRVNPKGVPCLYLATDKDTAAAEVNPYKGEAISIGCFRAKEKIDLVDFSSEKYKGLFLPADLTYFLNKEKISPEDREKIIWAQINSEFARPIPPHVAEREYIPTQLLCQALRKNGFNGIVYNSSLSFTGGRSVALFDSKFVVEEPGEAALLQADTIEIRTIVYENDATKRIGAALDGMSS